jgi:hypothetical protein
MTKNEVTGNRPDLHFSGRSAATAIRMIATGGLVCGLMHVIVAPRLFDEIGSLSWAVGDGIIVIALGLSGRLVAGEGTGRRAVGVALIAAIVHAAGVLALGPEWAGPPAHTPVDVVCLAIAAAAPPKGPYMRARLWGAVGGGILGAIAMTPITFLWFPEGPLRDSPSPFSWGLLGLTVGITWWICVLWGEWFAFRRVK